mmetsp:Transcript_27617/g.52576  ORF Transcript_27617/g.52576 Transcript_27617/m.52576 type:complete len:519 (+) Transcript_27617:193-1749(+)|eukprot:CAMPEP_0114242454 /NCGR_PEP_ID=MMETSP0058-20121206/10185_1 /TAXON_ID=36894 /ORGANISM="Pyramimonas parkeae, CCMP726" /LENGTH=518 /DNA_ID=CAMNT_0001355069 /DNA_START=127 /DNA_END=1683 /DNA_ORIENTATION=-
MTTTGKPVTATRAHSLRFERKRWCAGSAKYQLRNKRNRFLYHHNNSPSQAGSRLALAFASKGSVCLEARRRSERDRQPLGFQAPRRGRCVARAAQQNQDSKLATKIAVQETAQQWPRELLIKQAVASFSAGAVLGPLCDGRHSSHNVLHYHSPAHVSVPPLLELETCWWVPLLFGVAGVILGVGFPVLDDLRRARDPQAAEPAGGWDPSWAWVLACVSLFVVHYDASGALSSYVFEGSSASAAAGLDGRLIDVALGATALAHWRVLDNTSQGLFMACLTAALGPLIEIGLINGLHLYDYTYPDWAGIPSWIAWVYFCGAAAVGNLGRRVRAELVSSGSKGGPPLGESRAGQPASRRTGPEEESSHRTLVDAGLARMPQLGQSCTPPELQMAGGYTMSWDGGAGGNVHHHDNNNGTSSVSKKSVASESEANHDTPIALPNASQQWRWNLVQLNTVEALRAANASLHQLELLSNKLRARRAKDTLSKHDLETMKSSQDMARELSKLKRRLNTLKRLRTDV